MLLIYLQRLQSSSFFMNALYLMLSNFIVAAFGFIFWVLVTKTYSAAEVGLATTLLSVSNLLALLGMAGFDTTLTRFLPGSQRKNDYINSGLMVVTLLSTALAIACATALPFILPSLSVLHQTWFFILFVSFTAITSLNIVTNAVFLGYKQARYIFIINTLFSVFKIALPAVVFAGNAATIFVLAGSAQLLGLILSLIWMKQAFGYYFSPRIHVDILRLVKKFSFSMYSSSALNLIPPTLLPLLVLHYLGAAEAAYYYMAFTIASVLYTIAYASMQSVFAEGSHDELSMHSHVTKAAKLIGVLLIPAALITALLSSFLLTIFGQEYEANATTLLQLFAIGSLPVAIYSAMGAIFKVTKNLRGIVMMNIAYAIVITGFSYALIPVWGLLAIGWGWVVGNTIACGIGALNMIKSNRKRRF